MSTSTLGNMIVGEVMTRWPRAIHVFLHRGMKCPGCPMAPFMTVAEAAAEHGLDVEDVLRDLRRAIEVAPPGDGS